MIYFKIFNKDTPLEVKVHYKDNFFHREDGPAVEYKNGNKEWYRNSLLHREDGPAVENSNGDKHYYLNNIYYSEQQWFEIISAKIRFGSFV